MNITFEYLYRDGANYKSWGEVVLEAPSSIELTEIENRIRETLIDGLNFVAEDVGLPTLYFDQRDSAIDHGWHEYAGVSPTENPPTIQASIEELISRLAKSNREP